MSDPGKSYHFEIVCEDEQTAAFLKEQMAAFFVHAKIILRKQKYILYLKDSEEIIQILNVMEAHQVPDGTGKYSYYQGNAKQCKQAVQL